MGFAKVAEEVLRELSATGMIEKLMNLQEVYCEESCSGSMNSMFIINFFGLN